MYAIVVRLQTDLFDVSKERPNPINPIPGESILWWLKERLPLDFRATDPDSEDWGWYMEIEWKGRPYLIGASSEYEDGQGREWILSIVKERGPLEKLLGRERMELNDDCAEFIKDLLQAEPAFTITSIEASV